MEFRMRPDRNDLPQAGRPAQPRSSQDPFAGAKLPALGLPETPALPSPQDLLKGIIKGAETAEPELKHGLIFDPSSPECPRLLRAFHEQGISITAAEFSRLLNTLSNRTAERRYKSALSRLRKLMATLEKKQLKQARRQSKLPGCAET